MKKKKCFRCGKTKELKDFYKHPMMADGHLNKCKDCNKTDVKDRYKVLVTDPSWVDKERARGREKFHRLGYVGKSNPIKNIKYNDKYPEKKLAKLRSQNIKPLFDGAEKHHWSYNENDFKDVIHLTKKNHMKAHRFIVYDQERKMYRSLSGILLDTRERHEAYIMEMVITQPD